MAPPITGLIPGQSYEVTVPYRGILTGRFADGNAFLLTVDADYAQPAMLTLTLVPEPARPSFRRQFRRARRMRLTLQMASAAPSWSDRLACIIQHIPQADGVLMTRHIAPPPPPALDPENTC